MHHWTHMGAKKLIATILKTDYHVLKLASLAESMVSGCQACQQVNAAHTSNQLGKRLRENRLGAHWEN